MQFEMTLKNDWHIQSSLQTTASGEEISIPGFDIAAWYPTDVPKTVLAALTENGVYENPYFGLNLKKIDAAPFKKSWWYRKEFELPAGQAKQQALLLFDGINYSANIWLNGKQIGSANDVTGPYRRFEFNISENVGCGKNVLAVQVVPPRPGDFTTGFVDWNPPPPDRNMGIFRGVKIRCNNGVSVANSYIAAKVNTDTLQQASLTITTELTNHLDQAVSGVLRGKIDDIELEKQVTLAPQKSRKIEFGPDAFSQLKLAEPRLWWPNHLGEPNLYTMNLSFHFRGKISDRQTVTFGIRRVDDYFNEDGHRGFKINGRKILIKGGGWTDDLFLHDSPEDLQVQIQYVKHANLNAIRLEGFWGRNQTLYDLCDRYGILIMVGWSCQWEHEEHLGKVCDEKYGGVLAPEEMDLISRSFQDQVIWLRNHPAIFVWTVGSDKLPKPELEQKYADILRNYDTTRPYLISTGGVGSEKGVIVDVDLVSEISGSSGMKMLGPYACTPPVYWHTDRELGGAYGFNTETGPGAQPPILASIKKMIPENHLWPIDEVWHYHCGTGVFGTLDRFLHALNRRYGETTNVAQFARKAQVMNYELMRPMFEAFQANKFVATGVIQWMLNSAWPEMYWQLYDTFLMPNGAYYGAKKACAPLHLLYRYGFEDIFIVNDFLKPEDNLTATIRIFDIQSHELYYQSIPVEIGANQAKKIWTLPEIENLTTTYFLDLRLRNDREREIDNNFYWLSTKADVLDYEKDLGDFGYYTPSKEFADLSLLSQLPEIKIDVLHRFERKDDRILCVADLNNPTDTIAFFIDLQISRRKSRETVAPVFWEDNYFSLLPGEKREIGASFNEKDLQDEEPVLKMTGWNLPD